MIRFWPSMMVALISLAAVLFGTLSSYADSCGAIRSQLLSGGRSNGANPELAQLRRQLAAIQTIERQRQCTAKSSLGGLFNACADLARSRSDV
ncbi:hypothetical protein EN991_37305, partial [Mesorhizobium sp. M7A.F.Ca.US.005.03.2.1]